MTLLLLALLAVIPPSGQPVEPLSPMLYGNGTDGQRVQAVFVYRPADGNRLDQPWVDMYSQFAPQPPGTTYRQLIQHEANYIDAAYLASAQVRASDSYRRVRWVTDAQGNVDIQAVQASSGIGQTETFVQLGHRSDRLYLAWLFGSMPASCNCSGLATGYTSDDQFGVTNKNNVGDRYAVAGWSGPGYPAVVAHELTHLLGAVQFSAPHVSSGAHDCVSFQLMFARDGECATTVYCTTDTWDTWWLLDACGNDYYSTWPFYGQQCANCWVGPRQNYLWNHWNVANSLFLADHESSAFHFWDWQHETLESWVGRQPCYYGSRLTGNCNIVIDGAAGAWDQSVLAWEPQYRDKVLRVPLNVP